MSPKSIRYLPGGGAEVITVEVGEPGPGEVQVANTACGVCAWDMQTYRSGSDSPHAAPPGHEGLGYVTRLGPDVTGIALGDRVLGGGFEGLRNVDPRTLYRVPMSSLGDEHWIAEPASCVVTGIDLCYLKAGERVALVGCGFMGLMMVQVLAGMGLDQLVAIDVDTARLDLAARFGASEVFDIAGPDSDAIKADLGGRGFDVVIDTTGSQAGLDLSTEIVRRSGRISLFGWIKGDVATFNPSAWHLKGITVVNSAPAAQIRDPFPAAIRLIEKGIIDLKPLVSHVVPIEEYPTFMADLTSGKVKGYIKGVVTQAR